MLVYAYTVCSSVSQSRSWVVVCKMQATGKPLSEQMRISKSVDAWDLANQNGASALSSLHCQRPLPCFAVSLGRGPASDTAQGFHLFLSHSQAPCSMDKCSRGKAMQKILILPFPSRLGMPGCLSHTTHNTSHRSHRHPRISHTRCSHSYWTPDWHLYWTLSASTTPVFPPRCTTAH